MAFDRRLTDPNKYIDEVGGSFRTQKKINYAEAFQAKIADGDPPFNINRFGVQELTNKLVTRKLKLNPRLNFVGDQPEQYELFGGLGRFDTERPELYSFDEGKPNTPGNFTLSPDFKDVWVEAYRLSPTIAPDKKVNNPMPRLRNPDPRGYLMAAAKEQVENEIKDNVSVATLLSGESGFKKDEDKPSDEEQK